MTDENGETTEVVPPQVNGSADHINGVAVDKIEEKNIVDTNTNAVNDGSSEHSKEEVVSDERMLMSDTDVSLKCIFLKFTSFLEMIIVN